MPCAFVLALARAGKSNPARIAMTAMTTSSSIKVNAITEFTLHDRADISVRLRNRNLLKAVRFIIVVPAAKRPVGIIQQQLLNRQRLRVAVTIDDIELPDMPMSGAVHGLP